MMSLNFSGRGKVAFLVLAGCMIWVFSNTVQPGSAAAFTEATGYELGLRYSYGQTFKGLETVSFNSIMPRWGVFLTQPDNPLMGKLRLSFIVEGIVGSAETSTHSGWNLGITPLLKISYPFGSRFLGFIEGGAGVIWQNIDTSTYYNTFNFSPQAGGGVDIRVIDNFALSLAYRFQHNSNAGLYAHNPDVNSNFVMIGVSYYY
jgi:opacity protein-like surface antigen